MDEVVSAFERAFGAPPARWVRAPGRLELLGNHTDYNEGLVMALAVDRYVYVASAPRPDGMVELVSTAFPERERFASDHLVKNPETPWTNYTKGVLEQLRRRGVYVGGFNAVVHGTIPFGAGMSSSAALEVASALTVRQLYPFRLTERGLAPPPDRAPDGSLPELDREEKMALAKIGQAAEREFVGVNCGLLDQISSLFGREGQVIEIDCRTNEVQYSPMVPGVAVVVCDSGVKHDLAAGDYNALRRTCEAAARALGVPSLRSVTPGDLEANRSRLSEREYECAFHITGENERVTLGERALRAGEIEPFGRFLFQSHASSRDFFGNSCPELDILVEQASQAPGCYGARLTGGGFGGATINLVKEAEAEAFIARMSAGYREATGRELQAWICRVVDGAK